MLNQPHSVKINPRSLWSVLTLAMLNCGIAYAEKEHPKTKALDDPMKTNTAISISVKHDQNQNWSTILQNHQAENKASISQNGRENWGAIDQESARNSTVRIITHGNNNTATATQSGDRNFININQADTHNTINSSQTGKGNIATVAQITSSATVQSANLDQITARLASRRTMPFIQRLLPFKTQPEENATLIIKAQQAKVMKTTATQIR